MMMIMRIAQLSPPATMLNLSRGENANVLKKTSDSVMCWQCNGDKEEYYDHDSS